MPASSEPAPPVAVRWMPYVPRGLVFAIVLLRLACGFHFYREGTKKLSYDPVTGKVSLDFSAEGFLRLAIGPASELIREQLPNAYNWEEYLAKPRQLRPSTEEELAERAKWEQEYAARQKAAAAKKATLPVEFPPFSPYYDWADRIDAGWRRAYEEFVDELPLTEEQKNKAAEAYQFRRRQLADYLASEADAIAEWEHELWRLEQLKADGGAQKVPFLGTRIEEKQAETNTASAAWIAEVKGIERAYRDDLRSIMTAEQLGDDDVREDLNEALADSNQWKLYYLSLGVTCLLIGVGVCLMLGLFTRLAAGLAILFLLSVIATQPPWLPGAITDVLYFQVVEIAGLLVLLLSAAGRWAGLDYFIHGLFSRRRRAES